MSRHIIDPTFFDDAIDLYSFEYEAYIASNVVRDEYGFERTTFDKVMIRGSLQTQGSRLTQNKSGNIVNNSFKFYYKSEYRLNIGDFIFYDNKLLHVIDSQTYNEYGVRECSLQMTQLNEHRDLAEFIHLQTGDIRR